MTFSSDNLYADLPWEKQKDLRLLSDRRKEIVARRDALALLDSDLSRYLDSHKRAIIIREDIQRELAEIDAQLKAILFECNSARYGAEIARKISNIS